MRKRTIKEAYTSNLEICPEDYEIYLIRADTTVLYVGQSINTVNRLHDHMGQGRSLEPSTIGECIIKNLPVSGGWIFEEYTLEDVRSHLGQSELPLRKDILEEAMIKYFRPCLNVDGNPNPNKLPVQYEWREMYLYNKHAQAISKAFGLDD